MESSEGVRNHYSIVITTSLCLLLIGIANSPMAFDEHHYVNAARAFLAHAAPTNIEHPPFAKLIIAGSIRLFGDNTFGWRFPSLLAGTLLAVAIFGLTYKLSRNLRTAYIAWLLTVAGGFWYMLSRLAMISVYELAFEMAAVWLFVIALDGDGPAWYGAGLLFGLSISCRLFGVMGLLTCAAVALFRRRVLKACLMTAIASVVYVASWIPLLIREQRPVSYLVTAQINMISFHRNVLPLFDTGEPWWTWLVRTQQTRSCAPFLANPVIAICGLIALGTIILYCRKQNVVLPVLLYLAHMLPWVLGLKRITYYYYYFEAFTFLTIILALASEKWALYRREFQSGMVATALAYFIYWYPTWGNFPPPFSGLFGYH